MEFDTDLMEHEMHLRDYLRVIRTRKYTVLVVFFLVFILALFRTMTETPKFIATSEVLIEKYDMVVFDAAPVTPVTDTRILSKLVDGVIIVARAEKTTYDIIRKGVKSLHDIDVNILGLVINGFDLKKNRYYYGKEYSHSYGSYGDKSAS
jgi:hypothetical protein